MGRISTNPVYEYYSYDAECNVSICLIDNCEHVVKGKHGTNLEFHLSNTHPNEFTKLQLEKLNCKRKNKSGTNHEDYKRCKLDKLLKECVNLVTVHGRPFSLVNDSAFRNIIEMIPLESRERSSINAHKIRELVVSEAELIRNKIRREVNGKLISLKLDAATCMERSFLGINVQFLSDDNPVLTIRTLAVQELYGSHDAITLKTVVLNICKIYEISIQQIYSITTDNGSNMIKLVHLLEYDQLEESEVAADDIDNVNITWDEDNDDDIFLDDENNSVEEIEEINVSILRADLQSRATTKYSVKSVRCAAHTLQLAIADVLKNKEITQTIENARRICRKLRTPTIRDVLKAMQKRKPILDCVTRWHSTVDMIERLIELKHCCDQSTNKDLYLTPDTWNKLKSIVESLIPARIATKKLQEQHLTIGDFYHVWTLCILETSKVNSTLATELVDAMKKRQTQLFQNDIFLAGMFLDLRYNVVLSPQETVQAKEYLLKTWNQLTKIEILNYPQNNVASTSCYENSDSDMDEFESFMKELEQKKKKKAKSPSLLIDIRNRLNSFSQLSRLKSKENILHYWKKNKHSMPELYKLASIALAVPSTQVSVERLFSSLKYILSPLRSNLNNDIINDILLIRANAEKKS